MTALSQLLDEQAADVARASGDRDDQVSVLPGTICRSLGSCGPSL
jgi:hypothetical protein